MYQAKKNIGRFFSLGYLNQPILLYFASHQHNAHINLVLLNKVQARHKAHNMHESQTAQTIKFCPKRQINIELLQNQHNDYINSIRNYNYAHIS